MKTKISDIKRLIREAVIEEEIRLSQDSIDDQVDAILLRYEKDCILEDDPEASFEEGLISLRGHLFEAPEDEEEALEDEEDPSPSIDDESTENLTGDADKRAPMNHLSQCGRRLISLSLQEKSQDS